MATDAFQRDAFQINAFQIATPDIGSSVTSTETIHLPVNCVIAGQQPYGRNPRELSRAGIRHIFNER